MEKVKEFYEKNKKEIIIGGLIVGAVIATALITKHFATKGLINLTGKQSVIWDNNPKLGFMKLDMAKETLEANATTSAKYALVRLTNEPDAYQCIVLDNIGTFDVGPTMAKIINEA